MKNKIFSEVYEDFQTKNYLGKVVFKEKKIIKHFNHLNLTLINVRIYISFLLQALTLESSKRKRIQINFYYFYFLI